MIKIWAWSLCLVKPSATGFTWIGLTPNSISQALFFLWVYLPIFCFVSWFCLADAEKTMLLKLGHFLVSSKVLQGFSLFILKLNLNSLHPRCIHHLKRPSTTCMQKPPPLPSSASCQEKLVYRTQKGSDKNVKLRIFVFAEGRIILITTYCWKYIDENSWKPDIVVPRQKTNGFGL